ncbi:glutaredoxin family protein [Bradyrhizobium sp. CCBAU 45384]|uniref:glutaredoxin family protein n=1 Tax=Bradyrhizobium sp. CCBAU 45384 TaxID=858428 RepID=UPI002304ECAB|nr:NrdH-redoxin [Bradyrhizobium sp. CCBAU 45384]MDA9408044.1 glutaredoxin [Bradyrhizobium sp. CCBAU 45384]
MYASTSSVFRPPPHAGDIVVYGSRWRGTTMMVRRHLDRAGVPLSLRGLEAYPEARSQLEWLAGGRIASPTVTIGGQVLVQASLRELDWALTRAGYR